MSRRSADRWSAPVFMQLAKGSWGFQAGPEQAGGVLRPDEAMNREIYGPRATSRAILAGREMSPPTEAKTFLSALGSTTSSATARMGSTSRPPTAPSKPATSRPVRTTDSDVRTRIVDMPQTLDRLVLDSSSRAVGTRGPVAPPSLSIARGSCNVVANWTRCCSRSIGVDVVPSARHSASRASLRHRMDMPRSE